MNRTLRYVIFILLLGLQVTYAQESPLSGNTWAKFEIPETGMYRLTYEDLTEAGLNPSNGEIQVLGLPGGTLPQANDAGFPEYLQPLPIGMSSSSMGPGEYIYFFAEGPNLLKLSADGFYYDHNNYDTRNYVFVSAGNDESSLINARPPVTTGGAIIGEYLALNYHEETISNLLSSGRNWYGERFDAVTRREFDFSFPDGVAGGEVWVESKVMAQSFSTSEFRTDINGQPAGSQIIPPVPDFLNPPTNNPFRYSVKGRERTDTFTGGYGNTDIQVQLEYVKGGGALSTGFLDYLLVAATSHLRHTSAQVIFQHPDLLGAGFYTIEISNTTSESTVWDISDPLMAMKVDDVTASELLSFNAMGKPDGRYVVFNPAALPSPELEGTHTYNDFLAANPDLLIITPPEFADAAQTLASFRQSHDQLDVQVVTTTDVYDLMGSGRNDLTAIRNLARYYYNKGSLRFLLLFGKGSFDYYGILPFFSNYVPTYQSRNSLNPLDTYASDDYFGFMEPDEGDWEEIAGGNHTMDIGVGRLPVTGASEARGVVSKLIDYSAERNGMADWRTRLLFVADDEDFNLHHRQSDQLAVLTDTTRKTFQNKRVFLGSFPQESTGGGETSPKASEELNRQIRRGALVVNYTGHGNENTWTQEQILTKGMITGWQNANRLPLFVTATCEFGRHDDPRQVSGGELIVTEPNGGGVGILSTGRPVFASSNFRLNEAFYNALFQEFNGETGRLGDIMRQTKNESVDQATDANKVGNRNFTLLGDPSLRLAIPDPGIEITGITANGIATDSLKAGDRVVLTGEVSPSSFVGEVVISVRDKPAPVQTLDAPVYTYEERLNPIFSGKVSVTAGKFSAEFIVPRNISNQEGFGRIYAYAVDDNMLLDVIGGYTDVVLGGTSDAPVTDTSGPDIALFLGDSTNLSRTNINANTLMYIRLSDESGINVSGFGIGNSLTAVLDESETFVLNDYYQASKNTFQEGWAIFPLNDLEEGWHEVTITARDVFNNSNQLTIAFEVAERGTLIVRTLQNFPNPVRDHTTFRFTHNRPGEDLEVIFTIIDAQGKILTENEVVIANSRSTVDLPIWENIPQSEFITSGIYIYGIYVRSTLDGASDQKHARMMVLREK